MMDTWTLSSRTEESSTTATNCNPPDRAMQQQTGEREGEREKEEEGMDAEEAEHEQVKKDVTGWTLVTGSR